MVAMTADSTLLETSTTPEHAGAAFGELPRIHPDTSYDLRQRRLFLLGLLSPQEFGERIGKIVHPKVH